MGIKQICKMFVKGNVCVFGLRGTGKDMLFANVVARRKKPYISNIDYKCADTYKGAYWIEFNPLAFDCGKNTYKNFLSGDIKRYVPPILDGMDLYISDAGIYFPSQFCSELNRQYDYMPTYFALSRQLTANNVHINVQNLNRCWDKIREQSDVYIQCRFCKVIGKLVIQCVRIYEMYDSAVSRTLPFTVRAKLTDSDETRRNVDMQHMLYINAHGRISTRYLIYINKSKYDTREFLRKMEEAQ